MSDMRSSLGIVIATLLLIAATCTRATFAQTEYPNIVILLADDLGYGELGCQGNPEIATPNIDSIAEAGVRFTDGYVTAPFCAASRAGMMTGRYQTRFGFELNPIGAVNEEPGIGLPAREVTLAELLQNRGYVTALHGKWHLGGSAHFHPFRHGFDEFFGFMHEGHYFVPPPYRDVTTMLRRRTLPRGGKGRWTSRNGQLIYTTHMGNNEPDYDADNPIYRGGQPVEEHEYLTDALTREAVDFIQRSQEQPFFLYLAYNAVHSPLQAKKSDLERHKSIDDVHRRIFAAMLSNLDRSVGEVLKTIDDCNLEKKTLVVFLSDNGGPTRELTSSNKPLRGEKGQIYEGGLRIPFLMKWPGVIPSGSVYRQPIISLDLFATADALTMGEEDRQSSIDGVNLIPFLKEPKSGKRPHESLFWRVGDRAALRMGDWKIARQPVRRRQGASRAWELFDLANDISEKSDLADQNPEKKDELVREWNRLNKQMVDRLW